MSRMGEPFGRSGVPWYRVGRNPFVPVRGATLWMCQFRQDDIAWKIIVLGSQTIVDPGPDCGIAAKSIARIHMVVCGRMVDRFDLAAPVEAELVSHIR